MKKNSISILPGQKSWRDYGRLNLRDVPEHLRIPAPALLHAIEPHGLAWEALMSAVGLSRENPTRIVETPVEKVILQRELLSHVVEKRTDARERYGNFLIPTLTDPYEVWLTEYQNGYRTQYLGLFYGTRDILAIVQVNQDRNLFWNLIRARSGYLNDRRIGTLIFGK